MTKQEKIKESWGSLWTSFEKHIDNDGWIDAAWIEDIEIELDVKDGFDRYGTSSTFIRPVSLKGIENNNGWIKIESEDDLPKEGMTNYFICINGKPSIHTFNLRQVFLLFEDGLSHYQPIEKPKPPIY